MCVVKVMKSYSSIINLSHYILGHLHPHLHTGVLIVPHVKKVRHSAHPVFRYRRKVSVRNVLLLAKLPETKLETISTV